MTPIYSATVLYDKLFLDGNFRAVHHFWSNLYLNSTTVQFDEQVVPKFIELSLNKNSSKTQISNSIY